MGAKLFVANGLCCPGYLMAIFGKPGEVGIDFLITSKLRCSERAKDVARPMNWQLSPVGPVESHTFSWDPVGP